MRIIYALIFILLYQVSSAQGIKLSTQAEISVITIGPGNNLVDSFGHSAFRITDPIHGLDQAYNYGVYDFDTPNFLLKFARGKLLYILDSKPFSRFTYSYQLEKRWVREQVLDLELREKQAFMDYLTHNALPENRGYLYDFFYDNCATKLTEVASKIHGEHLEFDMSFTGQNPSTMRDLIHDYTANQAWGEFGIDLALGSVIDKKATPKEYQFLPDNIYASFKNATINGKPLVKLDRFLYSYPSKVIVPFNFWSKPIFILGLIALIVVWITYRDFKRGKRSRWLDFILFLSTGIIGLLMLLLWFATDHTATANNFNILWAFMPNLFVAFFIKKKTLKPWIKKYILLLVGLIDLTVVLWIFGVQSFPIAIIPILILLSLRYLYLLIGYPWKAKVH